MEDILVNVRLMRWMKCLGCQKTMKPIISSIGRRHIIRHECYDCHLYYGRIPFRNEVIWGWGLYMPCSVEVLWQYFATSDELERVLKLKAFF